MCLISFFILLPLLLHLSSIRLQITGAQEDRSEAEEGENRVKGRQLACNGRSRGCIAFGAAHRRSKEATNWLTCALKLKKKNPKKQIPQGIIPVMQCWIECMWNSMYKHKRLYIYGLTHTHTCTRFFHTFQKPRVESSKRITLWIPKKSVFMTL